MAVEEPMQPAYRSPLMAWVSVALTVIAWFVLIESNGYAAMAVAAAAVIAGFIAMPGRAKAVRNLAVTSVTAAMVLLVVVASFIIVLKIGLGS